MACKRRRHRQRDGRVRPRRLLPGFFDLRQRTLVGMDPAPAFRVVALGLVRKLRLPLRCNVLYGEVEDALGRYFRLLDADMQRFATLHETLKQALSVEVADALGLLKEGMRDIAVVLLACGEMQRRALDLKLGAQRAIASSEEDMPPVVSFARFAEFLEEALAVSDQLKRKHEELQQLRITAMSHAVAARADQQQRQKQSKSANASSRKIFDTE